MNITIDSKAFKIIMDRLDLIDATIKAMSANNGHSRWMSEDDVMVVTGLKRTALYERRKDGVFNWRYDNGRKIKYLRRDVEAYLNSNSTITKKQGK